MFMSRLFVATVLTVALQAAAAAVNVEVCNEGQMAIGYSSAPGAGDLVEYTGLILTHDCGTISQTADAGLDPGDQMCAGDYKYGASVECTQDQRGMLPISAKDTGGDSWVCQGLQKNTQCSSTVVVKACCSRSST